MITAADPADTSFPLHPKAPYRLDLTVWALRRRARNQIDRWDDGYRRSLLIDDRVLDVHVVQDGGVEAPALRLGVACDGACSSHDSGQVWSQVVPLLGVSVGMGEFYAVAASDPRTAALAERFRGVRPPRFPSIFEAMVNAIANQQLSLEVGLTLLNRLTAAVGVAGRAFPVPEAVLETDPEVLRGLGFSTRKAEYLRSVATAVTDGSLDEDELRGLDRAGATKLLTRIHGIGRWSAEYTLLRGLGRLDVFPGDDVGARNKLRRFLALDHDPDYREIGELLHPWWPFAGMLYFHLLLDGLAEQGAIDVG